MRLLSILIAATVFAPIAASAHTLDGGATLFEELVHQFASGHHLPLLLAVVAAALVIRRIVRETKR